MARKPAKRRAKSAAAPATPQPRPQTQSEIIAIYKAAAKKYTAEHPSDLLARWEADDPGSFLQYVIAARDLARKPRVLSEEERAIVWEIGTRSQAEWLDQQALGRFMGKTAVRPNRKRRPCFDRDHKWLQLKRDEGLTPAKIRDRWNAAHPNDPVDRETVKKGIEKADKEKNQSRG